MKSNIQLSMKNEEDIKLKVVYPFLEDLSQRDMEYVLLDNPEDPEDKLIKILPFSDDNICYALASFRPEEYSELKKIVLKNFLKFIKAKM